MKILLFVLFLGCLVLLLIVGVIHGLCMSVFAQAVFTTYSLAEPEKLFMGFFTHPYAIGSIVIAVTAFVLIHVSCLAYLRGPTGEMAAVGLLNVRRPLAFATCAYVFATLTGLIVSLTLL